MTSGALAGFSRDPINNWVDPHTGVLVANPPGGTLNTAYRWTNDALTFLGPPPPGGPPTPPVNGRDLVGGLQYGYAITPASFVWAAGQKPANQRALDTLVRRAFNSWSVLSPLSFVRAGAAPVRRGGAGANKVVGNEIDVFARGIGPPGSTFMAGVDADPLLTSGVVRDGLTIVTAEIDIDNTGRAWTQNTFIHAIRHEVGHSVGMDHVNLTAANNIIENLFDTNANYNDLIAVRSKNPAATPGLAMRPAATNAAQRGQLMSNNMFGTLAGSATLGFGDVSGREFLYPAGNPFILLRNFVNGAASGLNRILSTARRIVGGGTVYASNTVTPFTQGTTSLEVHLSNSALGISESAVMDGLSSSVNVLPSATFPLFFSLENRVGNSEGLPFTDVFDENQIGEIPSDLFVTFLDEHNWRFFDEQHLGYEATVGIEEEEDLLDDDWIVGLELEEGLGVNEEPLFFSVDSTHSGGLNSSSVYRSLGDGATPTEFLTAAQLGIGSDELDAFILDLGDDGQFDIGEDSILFSLSPDQVDGSGGADLYQSFGDGQFSPFASAAELGLRSTDNISSLDTLPFAVPEPGTIVCFLLGSMGLLSLSSRHHDMGEKRVIKPVCRESRRCLVGAKPTRPIDRSAGSNQGPEQLPENVINSYVSWESDLTTH